MTVMRDAGSGGHSGRFFLCSDRPGKAVFFLGLGFVVVVVMYKKKSFVLVL